jgi:hypothetical protein
MITVRRVYIFLVCAITLQSAAWAAIALTRNLLVAGGEAPITSIAFQIAVVVIGLPIFVVHWLWAQGLARGDVAEREASQRRLYLYGMLGGFLGPFLANGFGLIATLLWLASGGEGGEFFSPFDVIIANLVAMVVLALLWFYHRRITLADARLAPETGGAATMRRLYCLSFSAVGVTMLTLAVIHLLRWTLFQFGSGATIRGADAVGLTDEVARLTVGVPLWLLFWRQAQHLFAGPSVEERESALRKFYLYVAVFVAVLSAVANATFILAGLFRRLLDLPPLGDIRGPLPIVVGMAVLWAYHARVLRGDAALAAEAPRQAGIRRLYLYLVAAVGLAAFLVGLSGDISVLIRSLAGEFFGEGLRERLAWFTAALVAGLPVWILPWRSAQAAAVASGPGGMEERRSVVRKIYLYFYLFVATMTVLSSMVYIMYRLVSLALGERSPGNLLSDLGQAIAFSLIAVGVWLYHGAAVRGDGRLNQRERVQRLSNMRVVVVDSGEGRFGRAVLDGLRRELPGLALHPVGLTQPAAATMGAPTESAPSALAAQLSEAGLIVGPWFIAVAGGAGGSIASEIASAVVASPARKLLAPLRDEGWEWAGVDHWNAEAVVRQTVHAVKQVVEGEEVSAARPANVGGIIGLIFLALIVLWLLLALLGPAVGSLF